MAGLTQYKNLTKESNDVRNYFVMHNSDLRVIKEYYDESRGFHNFFSQG